jgi:hypothetical protein
MSEDGVGFTRDNAVVFRELWSSATIELTKGGPLDLIGASDRAMFRSRSTVGRASSKSSIFLRRKVGAMFMRVTSNCAHQVRPPLRADLGGRGEGAGAVPAAVEVLSDSA